MFYLDILVLSIVQWHYGDVVMDRIVIDKFDIKINKDNVLRTLGCTGGGVTDTVSAYFDEMESTVMSLMSPCAVMQAEGERAFCLLTVGGKVSDYSRSLFDAGEGMKGLLFDAMADEYLFAMDNIFGEAIRVECAKANVGIKSRLDAPKDFPLSEQKVIAKKTGVDGVNVTSGFMFEPVKTLGYILEFTDDEAVFNAQHDCSKCRNFNCPRRSTIKKGKFNVLSGYEYKPSLKDGDSAVCIDIGTTTLAFELVTVDGTVKSYKSVNPQRRFGQDVLSRIEAANRGRLEELKNAISYAILKGFHEVSAEYGDVNKVVIAGNTTMIHLLMGYSCETLGEYPFKSEHLNTIKTTFDKVVGNGNAPHTDTVIYGGISAFVGGDITSGLYMCDFDLSNKVNMFIDLGTNGEMAIGNSGKIIVSSTAAGPAFEGGRISCGVGSVDGAVCGIDLKSGRIKTIGDKKPVGLCGTGIIELVSELLDEKVIDSTGLLSGEYFENGYKAAENVVFTQSDIRQVQMAKSAVRAGIEVLADEYGIKLGDIDTVYLAGGFGYGLSVEKACNMGILPREFLGKTKVLGNSSLGGCVKYCSQKDGDERVKYIKSIASEISLGNNEKFNRLYIEYMNF